MMSFVSLALLYYLVKVSPATLPQRRAVDVLTAAAYTRELTPNGSAGNVTSGCVIVDTSKLTAFS